MQTGICRWQRMLLVGMLALAGTSGARATAPGMPEIPRLRIIGVEDGLPSTHVDGIAQDRSGYIWLATTDGLARYDGVEMRVWRHRPDDPAALPGNYITVVHVDQEDRVWVAVEGRGVSVLDRDRRSFRHYRSARHPQIGSDDTWAIASRDGVTWLGTYGGGLSRIGRDGAIDRFVHSPGDPASLPADTVLALAFDAAGQLWVGTTQGLARWTGSGFERAPLPAGAPAQLIYSITTDGDALWIGARNGLFRRDPSGHWTQPEWTMMFGTGNAVFQVIREPGDAYWVASQRGLWRVLPGAAPSPVRTGTHGPARPLQQMLRQASGALWLPVSGAGLGYLRPDWRRIAQYSGDHGGLRSEVYRGVAAASGGGVWLVGHLGQVEHLDRTGAVQPLAAQLQEVLDGRRLACAIEDAQGRLWLGQTGAGGLLRLDPRTASGRGPLREWRSNGDPDAALPGPLDLLALAPDGSIWSSSSGAGLQQRDPHSGRVLRTIPAGAASGLGVGDLEALAFDAAGTPWVAGGDGVLSWSEQSERFIPVPGLQTGDRVFALAFQGADSIWLQRLSGLQQYRRRGARWVLSASAGIADGVPAVEGSSLHVDGRGRVWLSSLRGLYRWDPQHGRVRRFGVQDGLTSQEFIKRAATLTADGRLVAAMADGGVMVFDTHAADPAPTVPALHWNGMDVRRDGRWVALDGQNGWTILPQDRELRVQLRLLAYDAPGSNRYYTRLQGYDTGWFAHGHASERVFAGLDGGDYKLRARAVDAAGNMSMERELRFRVLPPWWRMPWALAFACGALLLLAWWTVAGYRARLHRRRAQQRSEHEREVAQQASLAKTRFLATLGHEVRTPMTGVLGMSELLLGTDLDPRQRGYTESIRTAGEHLLRLVNDGLDLARIESGKLELVQETFDLHALVAEAGALMAPLARQRGLDFQLHVAAEVPRGALGDAKRVCQILLNLIGNAIKFTESGQVALRVSGHRPGLLQFAVSDTGPGLNEEQKTRLFRRFEQADGARTAARYGGSGLGLAICQELAAAMGGHIGVDSTPGRGTKFTVELPLPAAELPEPVADAPTGQAQLRSLALLLVEDEPTVARVLAEMLQAQGYAVTHAAHGLAALIAVATADFDLALLDLDLPGMDGLDLARQLRSQGFARPLVAITARADAAAEPDAAAAGFDAFIRKPVTGKMLAAVLEAASGTMAQARPLP